MGVEDYIAKLSLTPVTDGNVTFAQWQADFECPPEREQALIEQIGKGVFQTAFTALSNPSAVDDNGWVGFLSVGFRRMVLARVCESAIVDVPIEEVWRWLRDFNSHRDWHPAIAESEIENGLPADMVGAVRAFTLTDGGFCVSSF